MPENSINPFQSPPTTPSESPSVASVVAEQDWPFEATELAVIETIEPPLGRPIVPGWPWGKVLSLLLLSLVGLYTIRAGVGMLLTWLYNPNGLTAMVTSFIPFLLLIVLPMIIFQTICSHYFHEDVSTFRRLAKLVRLREPKPIPSLNSPNCQFVAIVPRERWQFAERDLTQEVAVLHINPYESRVIIEGAEHRFWIPAQALLKCGVDNFKTGNKQIWVLCLIVQTGEGPREVCLRIGNVDGFWQSSGQRKAVAEKFWGRVMLLKEAPLKAEQAT